MTSPEDSTGGPGQNFRQVVVPFERYNITVRVSAKGEFAGIVAVGVNQSFLSQKQKIATRGVHNVSDLYKDDE
jgi:hypothetical protein